jgi:saxitoxin biosynthesis operon SxtJ-like protein
MTRGALHEDMTRREPVRGSSDRSFGLVFAAAFLVIATLPLWKGGDIRWWSLGLGAAFLLVAAIRPAILAPLNRFWFKLGMLLGRATNPVVMGIVFFLAVTPAAFVLRLMGNDAG